MNKKLILGVAVMVAIGLLSAWALGWFGTDDYSSDPQVAALEKLRDETVAKQIERPNTEERADREQFRAKIGELSEEQRQEFFERSMPIFVKFMAKQFENRYDKFMAMTPAEQRKELDKAIDQMQARQQSGRGPGGPPRMSAEKMDSFRKQLLDLTTSEQRAKFQNGIRIFNDRCRERGIPPLNLPDFF